MIVFCFLIIFLLEDDKFHVVVDLAKQEVWVLIPVCILVFHSPSFFILSDEYVTLLEFKFVFLYSWAIVINHSHNTIKFL